MKNLIIIFCNFCACMCFFVPTHSARAVSGYTSFVYAQTSADGCVFYGANGQPLFNVPGTYCVTLLADVEDFYRAQYRDEVGFVKKLEVTPIKEKPQTPYLEGNTFRIFAVEGTVGHTLPSSTSPTVCYVEVGSRPEFYGTLAGEELVEGRTNLWFYAKTSGGQKAYFYSGYCDMQDEIAPITQNFSRFLNPFEATESFDYLFNFINISPVAKTTLIVFAILSCGVFSSLLFAPFGKKATKTLSHPLHNNHKNKHSPPKNLAPNKIQPTPDDNLL